MYKFSFFNLALAGLAGTCAAAAFEEVLPTPLETPPFEYAFSASPPSSGEEDPPVLRLISSEPRDPVDFDGWFAGIDGWPSVTYHNGGLNDATRAPGPPIGLATVLLTPGEGEFHLSHVIRGDERDIAIYGSPPNEWSVVLDPRILVVLERSTMEFSEVLDFLAYSRGPEDEAAESLFTFQQIRWAEFRDGVLYVSHAHRTYAASSGGLNGYITALDLETLGILWRSEPLVSNSENFVLSGDYIVTGYGFTDEEDFLCVLDRRTGETVERIGVPSAPEYLHVQDGHLLVCCYSRSLVFDIL
jgi:hypothetical protein